MQEVLSRHAEALRTLVAREALPLSPNAHATDGKQGRRLGIHQEPMPYFTHREVGLDRSVANRRKTKGKTKGTHHLVL
jgi:hypothetical protein